MSDTKICTKCGRELPNTAEYFTRCKAGSDKLKSQCKKCYQKYNREWLLKNPDKARQYEEKHKIKMHERFINNRERLLQESRERYQKNKERKLKQNKRWKEENKEKYKEQQRQYRLQNAERIKEKGRIYRQNNKEKLNAKARRLRTERPEVYKAHGDKYRLLHEEEIKRRRNAYFKTPEGKSRRQTYYQRYVSAKKATVVNYTPHDWEMCKEYFDNKCAYCGKALPLHQDHFIPNSKAGEYTVNNIVPACKSCNSSKRDRDVFYWYPSQKYFKQSRMNKMLKYLGYDEQHNQQAALFK